MSYAEATMEMTAGAFQQESEADKRLFVRFGYHPHLNQAESEKQGRPIFEDKCYIMIIVPGDKESIVHRPAWGKDFERFPKQYAEFQNKNENAVIGTPLNLVPWLTGSQIRELEYFHIRTVEHLATVNDNVAHKFHGLQGLKQRAKDFLEAATSAAPLTEMRAAIETKDGQIAALMEQLKDMSSRIEAVEKNKSDAKPAKA